MTREKQVAREEQKQEISAVAAQDKTEAASSRFTPAISHADVTDFAQLSSDAQPRPTSKTLVTRSSPPIPNGRYYAPIPENDDPASPISASPPRGTQTRMMFSLLVISVQKLPGSKIRPPSAGSG